MQVSYPNCCSDNTVNTITSSNAWLSSTVFDKAIIWDEKCVCSICFFSYLHYLVYVSDPLYSTQLMFHILPLSMKQNSIKSNKYFLYFQIGTNMPKYLEEIKNTQPYVLVLGSLMHPLHFFLIVERKAVEQTSLLKAIDACFKAFYVINVDYPWQCRSTWEYFQKALFCLEDAGGLKTKTTPAVIAMRTALKQN